MMMTCNNQPWNNHVDYHDIRIPGMESVVASITGYDGDEKSRLINNINSSGGFYVGSLRKGSTTHLVSDFKLIIILEYREVDTN